jgi:hypothetical protein
VNIKSDSRNRGEDSRLVYAPLISFTFVHSLRESKSRPIFCDESDTKHFGIHCISLDIKTFTVLPIAVTPSPHFYVVPKIINLLKHSCNIYCKSSGSSSSSSLFRILGSNKKWSPQYHYMAYHFFPDPCTGLMTTSL